MMDADSEEVTVDWELVCSMTRSGWTHFDSGMDNCRRITGCSIDKGMTGDIRLFYDSPSGQKSQVVRVEDGNWQLNEPEGFVALRGIYARYKYRISRVKPRT